MFSCEYCELFKDSYFEEHLGAFASVLNGFFRTTSVQRSLKVSNLKLSEFSRYSQIKLFVQINMENLLFTFTKKKSFRISCRTTSNKQRAKSNEQGAKGNEQRAKSNEQRAKSSTSLLIYLSSNAITTWRLVTTSSNVLLTKFDLVENVIQYAGGNLDL